MTFFEQRIQAQIDKSRLLSLRNGWSFTERTARYHLTGDFIRAVLEVETEEDALAFFDSYLSWQRLYYPEDAEAVVQNNIGWCLGEGMVPARIEMWVRACAASHPIFGQRQSSPEQAFALGKQYATKGDQP